MELNTLPSSQHSGVDQPGSAALFTHPNTQKQPPGRFWRINRVYSGGEGRLYSVVASGRHILVQRELF